MLIEKVLLIHAAQSISTSPNSPNRPSLETVVDGEAVILSPIVYGPLTEEQAGVPNRGERRWKQQ